VARVTDDPAGGTRDEDRTPRQDDPAAVQFGDLYDSAVESLLSVPVSDEWVDTRAGRTHVLAAGDPDAPPVVVLQGSALTTPVTLSWVQRLAGEYRLLAPDTPGQPGKSVGTAPAEYAPWLVDVLDGLGLDRAAVLGVSHGGGVLLSTAAQAPERIAAAVLVVPAGFGTPASLDLARTLGPALGYQFLPSRRLLTGALTPLFTQSVRAVEAVVVETIERSVRADGFPAEFPGPNDPGALAGFGTPTLLITGERDPLFPGERICKRAARDLPSLVDCVVLPGERHFLSPAGQDRTTERARAFLGECGYSRDGPER
jgi:pimeloyl-ACP methyl ester carboxylesterase